MIFWFARLDADLAAAVPNYQEIDADPRWLQWLGEIDPLTGAPLDRHLPSQIRILLTQLVNKSSMTPSPRAAPAG
jgi:hypothetical protein